MVCSERDLPTAMLEVWYNRHCLVSLDTSAPCGDPVYVYPGDSIAAYSVLTTPSDDAVRPPRKHGKIDSTAIL